MEKNDFTITSDQKSEILRNLEEIITKNLTLKALYDSIGAIVDDETADLTRKDQPIAGIPYLLQLAEITGKDLAGLTDKIFNVMYNRKTETE